MKNKLLRFSKPSELSVNQTPFEKTLPTKDASALSVWFTSLEIKDKEKQRSQEPAD